LWTYAGPAHPQYRNNIKAVKLTNIAGAYWRGDEKRKNVDPYLWNHFPQQKELKEYLELLEEAKKRDSPKTGC
jgi:threonyl-tRNA synthetase